jgi:hypothetical protein
MPVHAIPLALVATKVCASAVVSLAPAAATRRDSSEDVVSGRQHRRGRVRDFFKAEFYRKEFARLETEKVEKVTVIAGPLQPSSGRSEQARVEQLEDGQLEGERGRFGDRLRRLRQRRTLAKVVRL